MLSVIALRYRTCILRLNEMSDSYHVTIKNFRGCSKRDLAEQSNDPESDLSQWAEKRKVKREIKKSRTEDKQRNEP
jgi:hypothetical protein